MSASDRRSSRDKISVRPLSSADKPVRRSFPGPRGADAPLRVAIDRAANADLVAHAKESLDAEVCGVLVGQIAEDDEGVFVHVEAIVRGNAAAQGATHVTFTQATWDAIHETLEREHPKQRIVGWYHTHPGFGVEFSDMDLFIQRNFFSGPTQIALVIDPVNGAVAIAMNGEGDIRYLPRYWVDGREQPGSVPARPMGGGGIPGEAAGSAPGDASLRNLEARIGQLIQANDELRALFHRVVLTVGLFAGMAVIAVAGYFFYRQYTAPLEPPELNSFAPVPVRIGDKTVLLGVGVVQWEVPPELNALLLEIQERANETGPKNASDARAKTQPSSATPAKSTPAKNE